MSRRPRLVPACLAAALAAACAGTPTGGGTGRPPVGPAKASASPSARPTAGATPTPGATPGPVGAPTGTPGPTAGPIGGTPAPSPTPAGATPTPAAATATPAGGTPAPVPAIQAAIAPKLELIARLAFTQGRAELLSNNGGSVIANNGAGLISNHGGGVIANNGAGYRLAQAAPPFGTTPLAGEVLQERRLWDAGGTRLSYRHEPADGYVRELDVTAAGAPVREHLTELVASHPGGEPKTYHYAITDLAPDGALRQVRKNRQDQDVAGAFLGVVFDVGATKVRFGADDVTLDIDEFELDAVKKTGRFVYRFPVGGFVETGTLRDVEADAAGRYSYSWGDALGYYAGTSEVRDANGTLMFKKGRETAGGQVTRTYELPDGHVMSLARVDRDGKRWFEGPMKRAGAAVADVKLYFFGDGTTTFDLAFKDPPGATARIGWGYDPDAGLPTPAPSPPSADWRVGTVAGGDAGFADGAGGKAGPARFKSLRAIVPSRVKANRWYLADLGNNRVRMLELAGQAWTASTYAGTGATGDADGPAAAATFREPFGLAVGADDTLYVAEINGNRIRRVKPDGQVDTLAGAATKGAADGPAADARFFGPSGLAIAGDKLYVADQGNDAIRMIDLAAPGAPVSTIASLPKPMGLAIGDDGALYVAQRVAQLVSRVDLAAPGAPATAFAGTGQDAQRHVDGPKGEAGLYLPVAVAPDGQGGLFAAHVDLRRIAADGAIRTVAGQRAQGATDGTHLEARFTAIYGLVRLPGGQYLVTDSSRLRLLTPPAGR